MNAIENETDNKEDLTSRQKVNLLMDLWRYPGITRSHLTGRNKFEKELLHTMIYKVTKCFFGILIAVILIPFVLSFFANVSALIPYLLSLFLVVAVFFYFTNRYFKRKFTSLLCDKPRMKELGKVEKKDEEKYYFFWGRGWDGIGVDGKWLKIALEDEVEGAYSNEFIRWRNVHLYSFFGGRFIWWWVLIVGVCGAFANEWNNDFPELFSKVLGIKLMFVLSSSVLAFVATNIIHVLVSVRRHYDETSNRVGNINEQMMKSEIRLKNLADKVEKSSEETLKSQESFVKSLVYGKERDEFMSFFDLEDSSKLRSQKHKLLNNMSSQSRNFMDQVKKGNSSNTSISIAATINQYIENETKRLKDQGVITTYEGLGSIAENIVRSIYPDIENDAEKNNKDIKRNAEFYGMMLISPKAFIEGPTQTERSQKRWKEGFLKNNYLAAEHNIKQYRLFFSITNRNAGPLESPYVANELKRKVVIDSEGIPERLCKDDCSQAIRNSCYDKERCCTIGEAIQKKYHSECAYIRELTKTEFKKLFQVKQKKWNGKKHVVGDVVLLRDYFAVKLDKKWIFCLESLYNEEIDYAKIKVLHAGSSNSNEWGEVQKKLSDVFDNDDQNIPIANYEPIEYSG